MRNLYGELENARWQRERVRENSARPARSEVRQFTTGVGELVTDEVRFDVPFTDTPMVAYGCSLWTPPDRTYWTLPLTSGGVYRWSKQDGLYVGAWLWFRVRCDLQLDDDGAPVDEAHTDVNPATPVVEHHLAFTAVGLKPLPDRILLGLESNVEL